MSGIQRGTSRKSEMLDRLFGNRRRTILLSLAFAVAGYILFLIFGDIHAADDALCLPVEMGLIAFIGTGMVLGFQLINPWCSANAMDFMELFFALFSGVIFVFWFAIHGIRMLFSNDAYQAAVRIAQISGMWCALCLIHNLRK